TVFPRQIMRSFCPPPPQPSPPSNGIGVSSSTITLPPKKRSEILNDIRKGVKNNNPDALQFNGRYSMVHDGWKGRLSISYPGGEYGAADGRRLRITVRGISGHHIIFYIIGLGGESADGTGGQKFDGYLMTQTKDAIAGLTWWNNTPFGFYAIKK